MIPFEEVYERAVARHGEDELKSRFPTILSAEELRKKSGDRYLAMMAKRVFAAGFRWKVIQAKWDGFEEAFHGFDPSWVANIDVDEFEELAQDRRIVRNRPKITATVGNAQFLLDVADEYGSFGDWIAEWPTDDIIGLWAALKSGGERLGGDTGAWFLRLVGKDTFRFSPDVVKGLIDAGVVSKAPTGKRAQADAQRAFNEWADESGLPMSAISLVLSCSIGDIYEGR